MPYCAENRATSTATVARAGALPRNWNQFTPSRTRSIVSV
jgi:hypothetical protein